MALSNSDLSDLLDALRVGEGVDLIREIARWVLQELIETEASEAIGVGRYERVDVGRPTSTIMLASEPVGVPLSGT